MIMNVFPVCVGGNNKRILALGKPHGKFIAHLVGFFGGDLTGLERLPNLIGDHITFLPTSSGKFILPLGQHTYCGTCCIATRNPNHIPPQNPGVLLQDWKSSSGNRSQHRKPYPTADVYMSHPAVFSGNVSEGVVPYPMSLGQ